MCDEISVAQSEAIQSPKDFELNHNKQ